MLKPRILLIEDDLKIAKLLGEYLRGFQFEVEHYVEGRKGLAALAKYPADLLLLDVMLPDLDGFEVLKELRKTSQLPVIMLTARGETTDKIVGLEIGADDYLAKPFEPRELLARIQALLRRSQKNGQVKTEAQVLNCESLQLNLASREVKLEGKTLIITSQEFDLLKLLLENPKRVLSRDFLMDHLTGIESAAFDRSIDIAISRLRQKLGDDPKNPAWIKTVWGQGYLFMKEVK